MNLWGGWGEGGCCLLRKASGRLGLRSWDAGRYVRRSVGLNILLWIYMNTLLWGVKLSIRGCIPFTKVVGCDDGAAVGKLVWESESLSQRELS